jgi:DNA-binding LacI/PurR family transcriptional regulator
MDLSTIRQPVAGQALDVTTRLLARISRNPVELDDEAGAPAQDVVLPTEVVVRGSTDPSRTVY